MAYSLIITERADELLDELIIYLLCNLQNKQAAVHLIDSVSNIYNRIQENPFQFPTCKDEYLGSADYREAIIPDMNYIIIYRISMNVVYVVGIFHQLENYYAKVE